MAEAAPREDAGEQEHRLPAAAATAAAATATLGGPAAGERRPCCAGLHCTQLPTGDLRAWQPLLMLLLAGNHAPLTSTAAPRGLASYTLRPGTA